MTENRQVIQLPDPNPNLSKDEVLNFYAATYPALITALVAGPEFRDDAVVYSFTSTMGTKG